MFGRLAFKTRHTSWLNTFSPALALLSVHSAFHEGGEGFLKMEAFLSTIKGSVKGDLSILIADTAHLHAQHLEGFIAKERCFQAAEEFVLRFQPLLGEARLIYWHTLSEDSSYVQIRACILSLVESDKKFQSCLLEDAESAFTEKRKREFPDKTQFIKRTQADLIEQCIFLRILEERGYRYLFYPGVSCRATEYLSTIFPTQLEWIDVFLTIEKKTRIPVTVV